MHIDDIPELNNHAVANRDLSSRIRMDGEHRFWEIVEHAGHVFKVLYDYQSDPPNWKGDPFGFGPQYWK
jgi:hypothetical protein